ncbi:hypothetical protein EIKCOROL_01564 [Eikenella corrodens ATCC 23834]|uniref:Uncharacterized protein n=1 Tax=Eikenella corrodens ATCC 23834 TaxID=546274 RepID=C0DW18_EIKCO|nr:hypothetical protein EIKCOROL_01564 [Eikenella corrodens ATCC 23834]
MHHFTATALFTKAGYLKTVAAWHGNIPTSCTTQLKGYLKNGMGFSGSL